MNIVSTPNERHGERGNVLFLILIAVALFAALSYAVTQSSRSGGGDAGKETNLVNSAQITQYPSGIRTAIVRMIISGADINELEFNPPSAFDVLSDTTGKLSVFHPAGGGATYSVPPPDIMNVASATKEWFFNGENQIADIGTTNSAGPIHATADVIAFLPGVTSSVCNKLNESLGLSATTPPIATGVVFNKNMESVPGANRYICAGPGGACDGVTIGNASGASELNGKPFGCFSNGGTPATLVYYHVLVER